jgi:hypothetical protein
MRDERCGTNRLSIAATGTLCLASTYETQGNCLAGAKRAGDANQRVADRPPHSDTQAAQARQGSVQPYGHAPRSLAAIHERDGSSSVGAWPR